MTRQLPFAYMLCQVLYNETVQKKNRHSILPAVAFMIWV